LPEKALGFRVQAYGIVKHRDLFTPRQLLALTTFSDLAREARMRVHADACAVMNDDGLRLTDGGRGVTAYADAVATYLAFGLDKNTLTNTTLATWQSNPDRLTQAFSRHAMPMTWDFAEANPLSEAGGGFVLTLQSLAEVLERLPVAKRESTVEQLDARSTESRWRRSVVFTDPPYYDNIGYADLSDYFYVWQRRTLRDVWPSLTSTLLVPKSQELIASQFRHEGDSERARKYFEDGMRSVFRGLSHLQASEFPINVIYAFKQSEEASDMGDFASTGWETMLDGFVNEGFQITGTWPIRSELVANLKKSISALASSIVICGRLRNRDAPIASRREFILALKSELPEALRHLQHSSVAAVDLAQAAIGPGMAVFSRYAKVIEADGSQMRVRSALQLINQALDEVLSEQETEYDADTQWAVAWFTDQGMAEGAFGIAETLSKAKNTSVDGLVESGLLSAAKGKVRLIPREQLDTEWDPTTDRRLTIWEVAQHLIARLKSAGEQSAADLLRRVGGMGEIARDLAYRLYSVCERKGWTEEAIAYNSLVVAWPEITRLASQAPSARQGEQMSLG
jgi:putative DNA methylase